MVCEDWVGEALDEAAGGDELGVVRAREASRDNEGAAPVVSSFGTPLAKDASEVGFVCSLLASDNRWRAESVTDEAVSSFGVSEAPTVTRKYMVSTKGEPGKLNHHKGD